MPTYGFSPDKSDKSDLLALHKLGFISDRTLMESLGFFDYDEEQKLLAKEARERTNSKKRVKQAIPKKRRRT